MSNSESDIARRAARLYYDENKTQDEIGEMLDITRWKVGRLLALAREVGIVSISITDSATPSERSSSGIIPTDRSRAQGVTDTQSLRSFLRRLPAVDAIGLEARAATLATRSWGAGRLVMSTFGWPDASGADPLAVALADAVVAHAAEPGPSAFGMPS